MTHPAPSTPTGDLSHPTRAELAWVLSTDILRSAARWTRRLRRRADVVAEEYDLGNWRRVLEGRAWEESADLWSFVVGDDIETRLVVLDGRVRRVRTRDYYAERVRRLDEELRAQVAGETELVELGCGYGANLFSLALSDRWTRLRGFDISANALKAGRRITEHFGVGDRISMSAIDATDAEHPGWAQFRDATVFTYFCLEQLPDHVGSILDHLIAARPRRIVHMEPGTELLQPWKPRDLANLVYVRSVDYQSSVFAALKDREDAGRVRVLDRRRLAWAPTLHNDGFLVTWEPT